MSKRVVCGDVAWLFVVAAAGIAAACGSEDEPCEKTQTCIKSPEGGEGGERDQGGSSGSATGGSPARGGSSGRGGTPGNGGTSGAGGADEDPPTIEMFTPADGSAGVERDIEVMASLSEPIDERTVTETSVTLTGPDGDVTGTLNVEENVISFVPERPLSLLGTYTFTLDDTIADLAGNTLEESASVEFQVRDGRWGAIETPFGASPRYMSGVARNGNGDVLIGGTEPATPDPTMWAAIYAADERRWLPVGTMSPGEDVFVPSWQGMSIDDERRAVMSWSNNYDAWGWFRFTESSGWVSAVALAGFPHVAVSSQGMATAVWRTQTNVSERTLNVVNGTVETVQPVYSGTDDDTQIVASLGRMAVFGIRAGGSGREIAVSFRNPTGWSEREPVATAPVVSQWRVESDDEGNIVLLWIDANDTTGDRIWSRVYERENEAWTPDRLLMEAPPFSGFANPLISAGNVAVVVYRGMVPVGAYYEKGTGWLQSSIVELDGLGPFQWGTGEIAVELALDRRGNILAVGPTGYQRYLPGDGWQRSADHGLTLGKQRLWMAAAPDGSVIAITHDLTANDELIPQSVVFE